ncbi:MAG: type II toxin-antitoxin system VapC family toxin [Fimbriimonadaceae bacterium]
MSGLLLDTHAFLWLAERSSDLPEALREQIRQSPRPRFVSIATAWEIAIKNGLGKLELAMPMGELFGPALSPHGIDILPIDLSDTIRCAALGFPDPMHRDPFDRMLVAQALERGLTIVSRDPVLDTYSVPRLWA